MGEKRKNRDRKDLKSKKKEWLMIQRKWMALREQNY